MINLYRDLKFDRDTGRLLRYADGLLRNVTTYPSGL